MLVGQIIVSAPALAELPKDIEARQIAVSVAASDRSLPDRNDVAILEKKLVSVMKSRSLDAWNRRYSYDLDVRNRRIDRNKIAFILKQAGVAGIEPGLHIVPFITLPELIHGRYAMVSGVFDIRTKKVTFAK